MASSETVEDLYYSLMSRVEEFAKAIIVPQPRQSIWQLELDLVEYQREMRKAIADEEQHRRDLKAETATDLLPELRSR